METPESVMPWRLRIVLGLIGLLQGTIFWLVHESWPSDIAAQAPLMSGCFFLAIMGLAFQLTCAEREWDWKPVISSLTVGLIFAMITLWVWTRPESTQGYYAGDDNRIISWFFAAILAGYFLIPFIQIWNEGRWAEFCYASIFKKMSDNLFVVLAAVVFTGLFFLLIGLWVGLFSLIEIDFFAAFFGSEPFLWISSLAVMGAGMALGRENVVVMGKLKDIVSALCRFIMPMLALMSLVFALTLPFTGLEPLWATTNTSPILLSLIASTLFLLNAVIQDGRQNRPYPRWPLRLIEGSLLVLPVYSILTLYSIGLRIKQYGLMPERFVVVIIAIIGLLCSLGYVMAVFMNRDVWMGMAGKLNIFFMLLIVASAFLLHSPILDPISWSAHNQFNRLAKGRVSASEFDFGALQFELGAAGMERLKELSLLESHPEHEAIKNEVAQVLDANNYYGWKRDRR